MRRWMIALGLGALILSFQNCGEVQNFDGSEVDSRNKSLIEFEDGTIDSVDWAGVEFYEDFGTRFHIDLKTGVILPVDQETGHLKVGARDNKYCLTDDQLNELQVLIANSAVCVPNNEIPEGRMCTMIYFSPYAHLVSQDSDDLAVPLGERRNGCEQAIDLCEGKGDLLKGFLASIKGSFKSQACK